MWFECDLKMSAARFLQPSDKCGEAFCRKLPSRCLRTKKCSESSLKGICSKRNPHGSSECLKRSSQTKLWMTIRLKVDWWRWINALSQLSESRWSNFARIYSNAFEIQMFEFSLGLSHYAFRGILDAPVRLSVWMCRLRTTRDTAWETLSSGDEHHSRAARNDGLCIALWWTRCVAHNFLMILKSSPRESSLGDRFSLVLR